MFLPLHQNEPTTSLQGVRQRSVFFMFLLHHQQRKVEVVSLRACDKCAYHYSDLGREKLKQENLSALTTLCVHYLGNKLRVEQELKNLQDELPTEEEREVERKVGEERARKLNERLEELAVARRQLENEIESIRSR